MSLDVYLKTEPQEMECTCECCGNVHKAMQSAEYYCSNITHNLAKMAYAAGIYEALWNPSKIGITKAGDLIPIITKGLTDMKERPGHYKQFDASNGWGTYEQFVPWIQQYLEACIEYPYAIVVVSK